MKIYLVVGVFNRIDRDGPSMFKGIGYFSSREKAEAAIEEFKRRNLIDNWPDDWLISSHELDALDRAGRSLASLEEL